VVLAWWLRLIVGIFGGILLLPLLSVLFEAVDVAQARAQRSAHDRAHGYSEPQDRSYSPSASSYSASYTAPSASVSPTSYSSSYIPPPTARKPETEKPSPETNFPYYASSERGERKKLPKAPPRVIPNDDIGWS
jgi:hypothetical protein